MSVQRPNILLIAETINNRATPASRELAGLAERLLTETGRDKDAVALVVAGSDIRETTEQLAQDTGLNVQTAEHPGFQYPNPALLADVVVQLTRQSTAAYICFPHTVCGCQAAAKTAVTLNAACITAVEAIRAHEKTILFRRSLLNGKLQSLLTAHTPRTVLTALPGAFAPASKKNASPGRVTAIDLPNLSTPKNIFPLGLARSEGSDDAALEKADIIVAAGRGVGNEDNLEIIHQTARTLPNAAVGASRPLCDMKWLPYSRQVGATGRTVAPKLYLACGISGAQQHLQGMKDSQWIVAVNTDPNAAIFAHADYCIVEDLTTFLPVLLEKYKEKTD